MRHTSALRRRQPPQDTTSGVAERRERWQHQAGLCASGRRVEDRVRARPDGAREPCRPIAQVAVALLGVAAEQPQERRPRRHCLLPLRLLLVAVEVGDGGAAPLHHEAVEHMDEEAPRPYRSEAKADLSQPALLRRNEARGVAVVVRLHSDRRP